MRQRLRDELTEQIDRLPESDQRRVLDFARALAQTHPHGVAGATLLRFAGLFDATESAAISAAIEAECERIDADEW